MVCGWPSCSSLKSSLLRLLTIWPCLSRTVASTFTTFTSEEKVGVDACWLDNALAISRNIVVISHRYEAEEIERVNTDTLRAEMCVFRAGSLATTQRRGRSCLLSAA